MFPLAIGSGLHQYRLGFTCSTFARRLTARPILKLQRGHSSRLVIYRLSARLSLHALKRLAVRFQNLRSGLTLRCGCGELSSPTSCLKPILSDQFTTVHFAGACFHGADSLSSRYLQPQLRTSDHSPSFSRSTCWACFKQHRITFRSRVERRASLLIGSAEFEFSWIGCVRLVAAWPALLSRSRPSNRSCVLVRVGTLAAPLLPRISNLARPAHVVSRELIGTIYVGQGLCKAKTRAMGS